MLKKLSFCLALLSSPLASEVLATPTTTVTTPQPGSPVRKAILDAVRLPAQEAFGAPVEFIVERLKLSGTVAFVSAEGQRPGGAAIDLSDIPLVRDGDENVFSSRVEAFLRLSNGQWEVTAHAIDPTDIWWAGPPYCETYSALIPVAACE